MLGPVADEGMTIFLIAVTMEGAIQETLVKQPRFAEASKTSIVAALQASVQNGTGKATGFRLGVFKSFWAKNDIKIVLLSCSLK